MTSVDELTREYEALFEKEVTSSNQTRSNPKV